MLDHYDQAIGMEQLYEVPDAVLDGTGGDNALIAAWRLGRDMAEVLASDDGLLSGARSGLTPEHRLILLLQHETNPEGQTQLAAEMGSSRLALNLTQLEWLKRGLEGEFLS